MKRIAIILMLMASPLLAESTWTPGQYYGGIYETGGSTAITLTTAGTYYPWASTTVGLSSGMTVSAATDDITVLTAGTYEVSASCSFLGSASATITMALHEEGTIQPNCKSARKLSATPTDTGSMSFTCRVASVVNDSYTLQFTAAADTKEVTPVECNLVAFRFGP